MELTEPAKTHNTVSSHQIDRRFRLIFKVLLIDLVDLANTFDCCNSGRFSIAIFNASGSETSGPCKINRISRHDRLAPKLRLLIFRNQVLQVVSASRYFFERTENACS